MCDDLRDLTSFYTDCENSLFEEDPYFGNGEAEIKCRCCTDCCSPGPKGECRKRSDISVPTASQPSPSVTIKPTNAPFKPTISQTLEELTEELKLLIKETFKTSNSFDDVGSSHSRALTWLTDKDGFTKKKAQYFVANSFLSNNQTFVDQLYDKFLKLMSQRFVLSLFYYQMTGEQWTNCTAPITSDEPLDCSYMNRDVELVNGKKWLSDVSHCSWAGISCHGEETVVQIELSKCFSSTS